MSSFTSPLIVTPMEDGRKWQLHREFTYHIGTEYSKEYVHVPAGFITDFASVPWFLWSWLPSWGKYGKATILHDFCYQTGLNNRRWADNLFYEAMIVSGTVKWKANLMYYGVRVFGWLAWKRKV